MATFYETDTDGNECNIFNQYTCPVCAMEWSSFWSCACNDQCPECGNKDIEPYLSENADEIDFNN